MHVQTTHVFYLSGQQILYILELFFLFLPAVGRNPKQRPCHPLFCFFAPMFYLFFCFFPPFCCCSLGDCAGAYRPDNFCDNSFPSNHPSFMSPRFVSRWQSCSVAVVVVFIFSHVVLSFVEFAAFIIYVLFIYLVFLFFHRKRTEITVVLVFVCLFPF